MRAIDIIMAVLYQKGIKGAAVGWPEMLGLAGGSTEGLLDFSSLDFANFDFGPDYELNFADLNFESVFFGTD